MEELIKQAFLHVEVVGPQVQEGNYDLIGPDGEIILPAVWEKVVQPDWSITMHMWPMEKAQPRPPMPPMMPGGMPRPQAHGHHPHAHAQGRPGSPPGQRMPAMPAMFGQRMPGFRPGGGGPPPPPPAPDGWGPIPLPRRPGGVMADVIEVAPDKPPRKTSKPIGSASVLGWMAGTKPKSSGKKYVVA